MENLYSNWDGPCDSQGYSTVLADHIEGMDIREAALQAAAGIRRQ